MRAGFHILHNSHIYNAKQAKSRLNESLSVLSDEMYDVTSGYSV